MALLKKGETWFVRYTVPIPQRRILGLRRPEGRDENGKQILVGEGSPQIWRTTGTRDKAEARRRSFRITNDIVKEVEALCDGQRPASPKDVMKDLLSQVASGDMDPDTAAVLMHDFAEQSNAPERQLKNAVRAVNSAGTTMPISDAIEDFHNVRKGKINADTRDRQYNVLMRFAEWFGDGPVEDVTRRIANQYVKAIILPSVDPRTNRPRTFKSKSWDITALSTAWKYFSSQDWTGDQNGTSPWKSILEPHRPSRQDLKTEVTNRRIWSDDEIAQVLDAADMSDPLFQVWFLCLHHGTRAEEIAALKASHIDLKEKTFEIVDGKNEASEATMPMHKDTVKLFRKLVKGLGPEDHLFDVKADSKGRYSGNLVKRGGRWLREHVTDDKALTFYHCLRHTLPTKLEASGADPLIIKRIVRHKVADETFGTYSKPNIERMREVLDTVSFG